ncbi:MAG: recombinase family protein [Gemmataceae bacterium]
MKDHGLKVIFWKSFSSRIERAVIGAISQEGMEEAKRRMVEGNILKAKDGRITARTPAYGYRFVDSNGRDGEQAKKDTHYAPRDEEAEVVKLIFNKIAVEGWSTRQLSTWLEVRYAPPKRSAHWEPAQIALLVRNPVYKGEYVAQRYKHVRVPKARQLPGEPVKLVSKKIERPRDERIIVPVLPIISLELWQMANRALDKNVQMGRRNAEEPYLLTGLVKCATCGNSYTGGRRRHKCKDGTVTQSRYYRCSSRSGRPRHVSEDIGCLQGQIHCEAVDNAVWTCLCSTLLQPQVLIEHLESAMLDGDAAQAKRQLVQVGLNKPMVFIR